MIYCICFAFCSNGSDDEHGAGNGSSDESDDEEFAGATVRELMERLLQLGNIGRLVMADY